MQRLLSDSLGAACTLRRPNHTKLLLKIHLCLQEGIFNCSWRLMCMSHRFGEPRASFDSIPRHHVCQLQQIYAGAVLLARYFMHLEPYWSVSAGANCTASLYHGSLACMPLIQAPLLVAALHHLHWQALCTMSHAAHD